MRLPTRRTDDRHGLARILEDERFLRGLGLGALIGAAIAGSTLWNRRRETPQPDDPHAGPPSHESPSITR